MQSWQQKETEGRKEGLEVIKINVIKPVLSVTPQNVRLSNCVVTNPTNYVETVNFNKGEGPITFPTFH